jgi:parallel beta-helix repeat protein
MTLRLGLTILVSLLAACSGTSSSSSSTTAAGTSGTGGTTTGTPAACSGPVFTFIPDQNTCGDIQNALTSPAANTTLVFAAGTFTCSNTLNLTGTNLTLRGAGAGATIFDFSPQSAGSDGMLSADGTNGLTLTGFSVQNTKGNGIKVIGSNAVTFDALSVTWMAADETTHGAYGIYPVADTNVLIQNCSVSGSSDTGIYVGQSDEVIVRFNSLNANVAGIEIENTYNADVYGNVATDNAAGILVFGLPNLPQEGCHGIRVFDNEITANNRTNFAAPGDIVSEVPSGTGFFAMAANNVEVFGNTVLANQAIGIGVISYFISGLPISDPNYYPFPDSVSVHDNTADNVGTDANGTGPDLSQPLGQLLATAAPVFPNGILPALMIDGIFDPSVLPDAGGTAVNPMEICFMNNDLGAIDIDAGFVGFADLHFDQFQADAGPYGNLAEILTEDLADFTCSPPALPAIVIASVTCDAGL